METGVESKPGFELRGAPCVPEKCLACGADWSGGHQLPGKPMKVGLRVFYRCGASLSASPAGYNWPEPYDPAAYDGAWRLLFKNCTHGESYEAEGEMEA